MRKLIIGLLPLFFIACENSRDIQTEFNDEGTIIKITFPRETEENSSNNKPTCTSQGQSCGFSYSFGYENSNQPHGHYLKCKLEYWRPGENSSQTASYTKIFYSNCGTCLDAANKTLSNGFTSIESPTSHLIYEADGETLACDTNRIALDTEYTTGWSFRISTLNEGSSCQAQSSYYSYPSNATSIGEDACEK